MQKTSKLILSQLFAFPAILQASRQGEFQFDVRFLLRCQIQKFTRGADLPTSFFQSFFFCFFHSSAQLVIYVKTLLARVDHSFWSSLRFLTKYFKDDYGIRIYSKHDSPCISFINDPQFVTPTTNGGHRPRLRQAKFLSLLKLPQQIACFEPCGRRKGRSFYLAFKPDERLFPNGHHINNMSFMTYCQE